MNILLIFFALPVAVIIISVALQRILKCPILVSAIIFAIFLVVTFVINNLNFLVVTIIYAIISFITAFFTCFINRFLNRLGRIENNILTFDNSQNCCNENNNEQNNECGCNYQISNETGNGVSARINVIPNVNTNGQTGMINGCYRRRNS